MKRFNVKVKFAGATYAEDYVGWWFYRALQFLVNLLPLRLSYIVACRIADICFIFDKRDRGVVTHNLKKCPSVPKKRIDRYARNVFRNFCKNVVDFLRFPRMDADWFKKNVELIGAHHVTEAMKRGRGAIIISAHLGNVEIGAFAIQMFGFPANAIWLSHKNPRVEKLFVEQRLKKGIKMIPMGSAMGSALRALRSGEMVAFLIDHSYSGKGVEVDFFGEKTQVPKGVAIAALKTGAPIIPVFGVRSGPFKYKLICAEEVAYKPVKNIRKDVHAIMQSCIKTLEKHIAEYPDQWVLSRRFCW